MARNMINWFEIPVADFKRAKTFYESALNCQIHEQQMGEALMGFLPFEPGDVSGAIVSHPMYTPSADGVKIYLNGDPDLQTILDRIPGAGGQIVMSKTQISPEIGYMAMFIDTEGNTIALHSSS